MRISDWSSDVCSSDLDPGHLAARNPRLFARRDRAGLWPLRDDPPGPAALARAARELAEGTATLEVGALSPPDPAPAVDRSEERRVGKECVRQVSTRWSQGH